MKRKIERKGADRKISVAGKIGATTLAVAMIATSFVGAAGAGTYAASKNDKSSSQAANTGSYSDVFSPNSTSQKDKSETVYAVLDAEGNKEKVVVNEWLTNKNGAKEISDTSDLKDIKNTSGNQKFTKDGDKVTWKADGSDIHYQGTTGKQLPVDVAVSYYLNGEQVSAKDIAGKSGDVEIHFDYKVNRSELADGSSVTKPYTMASAVMLDNSHFTNVTVDNGKVVNDGNTSMCIGIAFPGLAGNLGLGATGVSIPDSVVIKAHTDKFQIDGTYTAAMSGVMSDIDTSATGNVESKVSQLESGLDQLVSASDKLMSGTDQLKAGIDQLNAGAGTLKSGTQELALGADQLDKSVKAGGSDLSSQILTGDQITAYGAQAKAAAEATAASDPDKKIEGAADQATSAVMNGAVKTAVQLSVEDLLAQQQGYKDFSSVTDTTAKTTIEATATVVANKASQNLELYSAVKNGQDGKPGLKGAFTETAKQAAGDAANEATVTTATTINDGIKASVQTLAAQMNALSEGTGKISAGASKLNSGAGDLYTGTTKLSAGAATLDSGMAQFNKEGIHKMADTLNGSQLLTIGKRIKAAADADRIEYLIGGKSAGMSGESKIIYKTAEVK